MASERRYTQQSSGFFFDVEKWFGSISAQRMSFAEKGVYLVMLFQEWRERGKSLPDDAAAVADLIAITPEQAAEVAAAWSTVRKKFVACEREQGRIFNLGIERTRRAQLKYHRERKESGRKGGKARASNKQKKQELDLKLTLSSPQAKSSDLNRPDMTRDDQVAPARARDDRSPNERLLDAYRTHWSRVYRQESSLLLRRNEAIDLMRQIELLGEHTLMRALSAFFGSVDRYLVEQKHPFGVFLKEPTKYLAGPAAVHQRPTGCRHTPECADDAAHTTRMLLEKQQVPA
jgi:uncharacterized protein YdaU (DUF1376 family)